MQSIESNYVTTFLHNWIDLIYGYKQQGQEAVNSYNVFYYLTYPSNCDITNIEDENMRSVVLTQAAHFGQCPQVVFKAPHVKKRLDSLVPRQLRNVLLESDPTSLYHELPRTWMGNQCRIQAISNYSSSMLSRLFNYQLVLGDNPVHLPSVSSTSQTVNVPSCITWPPDSIYPWSVTIDCCELVEMTLVKAVLKVDNPLSYNIKSHCFMVEYFNEENTWKELPLTAESIVRKEEGVVAMLSFLPVCTRYWKLTVLDIPFTSTFVKPSVTSKPAYTSGDVSRDIEKATSFQSTTLRGPCIQNIDVMGKRIFPHVPPKGFSVMQVTNQHSQFTKHAGLWYLTSSFLKA